MQEVTQDVTWTVLTERGPFGRCIYIPATESRARDIFERMFGSRPQEYTAGCARCGTGGYSMYMGDSLAQVSSYHRGCLVTPENGVQERWCEDAHRPYIPVEEYVTLPGVRVVTQEEIDMLLPITAEERAALPVNWLTASGRGTDGLIMGADYREAVRDVIRALSVLRKREATTEAFFGMWAAPAVRALHGQLDLAVIEVEERRWRK